MPRQVLLTTAGLTLFAGVLGFWLGLRWEPLDESDAISRVIALHVEQTGQDGTDCVAVPGADPVWIEVICGTLRYDVDRQGRVSIRRGGGT